jgi:psp operon transcriptional activator
VDKVIVDPFPSPFPNVNTMTNLPEAGDVITRHEEAVDFPTKVALHEVQLLRAALTKNSHNQRRTATALGLSYDQLRGLVRKYNLTAPNSRKQPE